MDYLESVWQFFHTNQGASTVTIVGSIVGIIGILVTIRATWITLRPKISKKQKPPLPERSRRDRREQYITTKPVTPPNFVGRKRELRSMQRCLENEESIALLGDRRIGKSSLLQTWWQQLRQQNYPVYLLNGQNAEGASLAAFVQTIVGMAIDPNSSADQAANELMRWADLTAAQHRQRKPLILVDECERIFEHCPPRFWERVRGGLERILWIFSSRQALDTVYQKYYQDTSPLHNQLKTVVLGLLEENAAEQLIQRGNFSSQQQVLLREWAGRHPFYLQLLAQELDTRRQQAPQAVLDAFKIEAQYQNKGCNIHRFFIMS